MIPICEPLLGGNEEKYVRDAIKSGWISSKGKYIEKFEDSFAKFCGVKHGISTCNGTTALHLGLIALGIKEGDEAIIPDFTMIASAASVCYTGAKPVFVDAELETWNINPDLISKAITSRTKAIMPVHIYGHPCDMEKINNIAKRHKLFVIEDASEAHGAKIGEERCGSLGDIAAFSFYANKNLTTGEGGMIVTDNDDLAERCRYFRDHCYPRIKNQKRFVHEDIGYNYRMSNIHAAIGLAQTERAEDYINMRRKNNSLYRKYLKDIGGLEFQAEKKGFTNVFWMNGILLNQEKIGIDARIMMSKLKEKGIDTRPFFTGMHAQKGLQKYGCRNGDDYRVSKYLEQNGFYLPSSSGLKEEEIEFICDQIKTIKKKSDFL